MNSPLADPKGGRAPRPPSCFVDRVLLAGTIKSPFAVFLEGHTQLQVSFCVSSVSLCNNKWPVLWCGYSCQKSAVNVQLHQSLIVQYCWSSLMLLWVVFKGKYLLKDKNLCASVCSQLYWWIIVYFCDCMALFSLFCWKYAAWEAQSAVQVLLSSLLRLNCIDLSREHFQTCSLHPSWPK